MQNISVCSLYFLTKKLQLNTQGVLPKSELLNSSSEICSSNKELIIEWIDRQKFCIKLREELVDSDYVSLSVTSG